MTTDVTIYMKKKRFFKMLHLARRLNKSGYSKLQRRFGLILYQLYYADGFNDGMVCHTMMEVSKWNWLSLLKKH